MNVIVHKRAFIVREKNILELEGRGIKREWTNQGEYGIIKEKAKRRKSHEKSNNRRK